MRHPRPEALDTIEPLLRALRTVDGLAERSRGVFYRRSKPFLHFHEDPTGMYADLKVGAVFDRHRVTDPDEQAAFLGAVRDAAATAAIANRTP